MDKVCQKSSTLFHDELLLVISLLYHKPPLTPPAHTFLPVGSLGSQVIVLVLPPTLLGPNSTQGALDDDPGMANAFILDCKFK